MKQSTYEKISKAAAFTRRYEPQWYLGWAGGCAIAGIIAGTMSAVAIGVMYLFMASLAKQRNDAERHAEQWESIANAWENLYESARGRAAFWQEKYYEDMP